MSRRLLFLTCFFLYSLSIFAKTVVISDIDDTLKKSNSMGKPAEQVYHFLRKIPYLELRDLFVEMRDVGTLEGEDTKFYYVSAAYQFTFNAQAWISKYHFPAGLSYLKTKQTKAPTYDFKYKTIKKILEEEKKTLESGDSLKVYMFGDNAQFDASVYSDLKKDMNLEAFIYIRDVRAEATFFDNSLPVIQLPGLTYYFSEVELFLDPEIIPYVSQELFLRAHDAYKAQKLIPNYTLKTLERRLISLGTDKTEAKFQALSYWRDYHEHRF